MIKQHELWHIARTFEDVRAMMTFSKSEPREFLRFLSKFTVLNHIPWTKENISSSIAAVCHDLKSEGVDYCWLSFSTNKYKNINWSTAEAVRFIYEQCEEYMAGGIGLVLSIKYEAPMSEQLEASEILSYQIADKIVGIDLVGDESCFNAEFHSSILQRWRDAGKMARAHVGESGSVQNICRVLPYVTNIAHGIKIMDDYALIDRAIDSGVSFDLGLTSNFCTGVVKGRHPVADMINHGLCCTIGTDDPIVCGTTISREYELAKQLGVDDLKILVKNAENNAKKFI